MLLHLFITVAEHPYRSLGTVAATSAALILFGFLIGRSQRQGQ